MYYNKRLHPRQPGVHGVHYQDCAIQQYNRLVEFFEQAECEESTSIKGSKLNTILCTCEPDARLVSWKRISFVDRELVNIFDPHPGSNHEPKASP